MSRGNHARHNPQRILHPARTLLLILALFSELAVGQDASPPENDCRTLFHPDDPALFRMVDTRSRVDYSEYAGMTIAGFRYVTLPIFNLQDPEEDNWFFRTANTLHVDTQAETIRRQMILDPGDALAPEKIRENERLLRDNSYLVDAMILPHKICGQKIHLMAVVRDIWTLTPEASASRSGGENSSQAAVTEDNLLGTGQELSLGYYNNAERSGRTFGYSHPSVLGEHATFSVDVEDNADGHLYGAGLTRPFYQLDSTWSASLSGRDRTRIETIESAGAVTNRYRHDFSFASAYYGWSAGRTNGVVNRWTLGVTHEEHRYQAVIAPVSRPPENTRLRYPWLRFTSIEDRFKTLTNISHSHRHEDILVGFFHETRLGYARKEWESTSNAWIYSTTHQYTAGLGDHHLMRVSASARGRHNMDTDLPEGTIYSAEATYYHFPERKNRWFSRFSYHAGRNLNDEEELTSGGKDTLRGYPDDIQRGNKQWIFTLERRHFTNIDLFNLAYLGGAAYIDAGRTWDSDVPETRRNDTLANFGLGLRVNPSKFNVDEVLHVDIAWPLVNRDQVDNYQVIVSGEVDF